LRALVTGLNGFAGSHLADFLLAQGDCEIIGGVYGDCANIAHLGNRVTYIAGNLTDPQFAEALLTRAQPDLIYHLAGQAFPPISWQDPWTTIEINLRSQVNLLSALVRLNMAPRMLVIGSMEEYGKVEPRDIPVTEETALRPESPYGVSKMAQDFLGLQYFLSHHLPIIRVRPSNHIGPRQSDQFVTSNFAKQVAEIELGKREPVLRVGNLSAQRDFTDVRDMARAYYLAITRGAPGEVYNIGSEYAVSIQHIVEMFLAQSRVPIRIEQDPARLRPSDRPVMFCSAAKFRAQTDWRPTVSLETSLRDILDYWRIQVNQP